MATSAQLREQIAAGRWDGPLAALYGTAPQELARQRARYCAALEQFELYFGPGRQVQVYSAPGRAELGGNHTDHQHGYGLAAAVTLDLVAVAARNTDGYVRVKSRGFNKLDVIDLATAEPQEGESTHSASLIRGIAEGFRTAGKAIGGFDAYTASDVLRGSGLSSSAAFEMGMACIWNGEYACGWMPGHWPASASMRRILTLANPAVSWTSWPARWAASFLPTSQTRPHRRWKRSTQTACCRPA